MDAPDIFLSYAREDLERARALAEALEGLGWEVFWDRKIPTGSTWPKHIGEKLEKARCVVVAWTAASVGRRFVREEAEDADERGVLRPVRFEDVKPPLGLRSVQAADLIAWDGDKEAPEFKQFVKDLSELLGEPPGDQAEPRATEPAPEPAGAESAEPEEQLADESRARHEQEAEQAERARAEERARLQEAADRRERERKELEREREEEAERRRKAAERAAQEEEAHRQRELNEAYERAGDLEGMAELYFEAERRGVSVATLADAIDAKRQEESRKKRFGWITRAVAAATMLLVLLGIWFAARGTTAEKLADSRRGEGAPTWEDDSKLNQRVRLQGGRFLMGSPEGAGAKDERPQHGVILSTFYLQEHEVTKEEYLRFDRSYVFQSGDERLPVVDVSWNEALSYAEWLGGRLPTEAEWEYAAKGGCPSDFCLSSGEETNLEQLAWHSFNTDRVHAVQEKEPNQNGVYDIYGNVMEWVADWYDEYSPSEQPNPTGPKSGSDRVIRGGSWDTEPVHISSTARRSDPPSNRNASSVGFRVAWPTPE